MLNGGKYFSRVDLKQAYQQIQLDDQSCEVLTLNTHLGLLQPKRLLYGINNAAQIFQSIMDKMLVGIPGILCYQDDILVSSETIPEHIETLNKLFARLSEHNVQLNREKCTFLQEQVTYLSHKIDKTGIHPNEDKVEAIRKMKPPTNVSELRTFIGMINYYMKFIPNASTLLYPLYRLLHKNVTWHWTNDCETAFANCKAALTSDLLLVHYDHKKKITLACDASPFGIGSVLSHIMDTGEERPIAYASRTLTKAEANYSQLEREAVAIVFSLKHFQQYIYGRQFTIITDHKPLIPLLGPNTSVPAMAAARIQRWSLLLSAFNYSIEHRKGSDHGNADTLSQFPLPNHSDLEGKCFKLSFLDQLPLTSKDIKSATRNDQLLGKVLNHIRYGWRDDEDAEMTPYYRRRDQLSIDDDCVLWGMRVVIPAKHQEYFLELLHDTHQGVTKMKSIARSHIWWPNIDLDIERISRDCPSCQQTQKMPHKTTLQSWVWPKGPWDRVHLDFAQKGDKYFLILVDAHSKWIEVFTMQNITTSRTIDVLRMTFSRYGIPLEIVSDNGPQFTSSEFKTFMQSNAIKHTLVPPYHPSSNGAAERSVQSFKLALEKMNLDVKDLSSLNHRISRYLLNQHATPHSTTGVTPSKLFLGRELHTRWSLLHFDIATQVEAKQFKQKSYHDRGHTSTREISVGDKVYVRNMNDKPKWLNGTVTDKQSSKTWTVHTPIGSKAFHTDQIRPIPKITLADEQEESKNESPEVLVDAETPKPTEEDVQTHDTVKQEDILQEPVNIARRTSTRIRKPPERMNLYVSLNKK